MRGPLGWWPGVGPVSTRLLHYALCAPRPNLCAHHSLGIVRDGLGAGQPPAVGKGGDILGVCVSRWRIVEGTRL